VLFACCYIKNFIFIKTTLFLSVSSILALPRWFGVGANNGIWVVVDICSVSDGLAYLQSIEDNSADYHDKYYEYQKVPYQSRGDLIYRKEG
jgi:hypothetical protein